MSLSVVGALGGGAAPAIAQRPAPVETQIVGGTPPNRAWPAQGLLQIAPNRVCGGTLVSGRWFLTAGHCVTSTLSSGLVLPPTAFTVNLGESDVTQFGGSERFAVDLPPLRHELYSRDGFSRYDLALLHLATPTPATERFEPMRLVAASEAALWSPGVVATIIGWGNTKAGTATTQLRQAGVPINSDAACENAYSAFDAFDVSTMLCAGDGTSDTCNGDSGGPLMVPRVDEFALAGITSFGGKVCGDPALPGVYTRAGAAALNAWIRARIPTAAIEITPQSPEPDDDVALQATASLPSPTFAWDLDDDGRFDDAAGPTASLPDIGAGSHAVHVQATYPDGDRALAREVITTAGSPLPQPPPPPPPPPKPVAPAPPVAHDETPPPLVTGSTDNGPVGISSALAPLARLLPGSKRVRVRSLLDRRTTIGVACSTACGLSARMTLDGRTARRLRLGRTGRSVLVGTGRRRLTAAGSVRLSIGLTTKAVRALRRARSGSLRIRVTATAGSGTQRLERTLKLVR